MKTDFINNMTHEFKTPIATISLASDSITNRTVIENPDKIKRFAGIIKQENKRMLDQVEKVLQMAKIDKRDFELKLTDVNINEVVYQASENSRLKIIKREGSLEVNLDASNALIQGDLTHISNIIHNLLDNAEKYSNEKPKINVKTKDASGGVEVLISDNGIGMTQESIKHIFDKFYRVHTGNRHDVKGFGLGLSYVKALMDAHNGKIKVSSELGKGSTFSLFFPFLQSD
jgi:two-component system phosphate regulon sensor histidine kinase PhoR